MRAMWSRYIYVRYYKVYAGLQFVLTPIFEIILIIIATGPFQIVCKYVPSFIDSDMLK